MANDDKRECFWYPVDGSSGDLRVAHEREYLALYGIFGKRVRPDQFYDPV
jgi:hypothetical protein